MATTASARPQATEEWLLGRWEAFLTPNLLAVTQASAGRSHPASARPETPSAFEQAFLAGNALGPVAADRGGQSATDSPSAIPRALARAAIPTSTSIKAQELLDWMRGKLLVKAGFDVIHNVDETSLLRNQTGTYHYSNVENFASDALVFAEFGVSGCAGSRQPAQLRPDGQGVARLGGRPGGIGRPALLLLLLADDWAKRMAFKHQRLGRIRNCPVAGEQASGSLGWIALGAGAEAAAACRAEQSRAAFDGDAARAGQQLGSALGLGRGNRRYALAGAAPGLWNLLRAHGKPDAGDGADPDRLAQRRSQLFHAADRRSAQQRRRRSAISLRAGGRSGQLYQTRSGGVCRESSAIPRFIRPSSPWKRPSPAMC